MQDEKVSTPLTIPVIDIGFALPIFSPSLVNAKFDFRYVTFFRLHMSTMVAPLGQRLTFSPLLAKMAATQKTSFILYSFKNRQSVHDRPQLAPTPHLLPRRLPLYRPSYHPIDE